VIEITPAIDGGIADEQNSRSRSHLVISITKQYRYI
jgi:hypothetical protein